MPCNASDKNKPDNLLISTAGMGQDAKVGEAQGHLESQDAGYIDWFSGKVKL
jgi:hypothetical protein